MVDVWLLFSISLIFFVIVFHVLIDMAADGKLFASASRISSPLKVAPAEGKEAMEGGVSVVSHPAARGVAGWILGESPDSRFDRNRNLGNKLFTYALAFIPCYFSLFNVIYWIYIFA